jgi:hypothetical protein
MRPCSINDCPYIIHPPFESRQSVDQIGETSSAAIQNNEPREGGQAFEESGDPEGSVPRPSERPGARIERAHRAQRLIHGAIATDPGSDDQHIVDDRWRRSLFIFSVVSDLLDVLDSGLQINCSAVAEIRAPHATGGIERDQACIDSTNEDSSLTCLAGFVLMSLPLVYPNAV